MKWMTSQQGRMIRMAAPAMLTVALCAATLSGCRQDEDVVRIGVKDFNEQSILAHMIAAVLRKNEKQVGIVPCGDTFGCQQLLRAGEIDVMVDYTGTGLQYVGAPPPDTAEPLKQLNTLYAPTGLKWLLELGFDNHYVVVVPKAVSVSRGWRSLSDLSSGGPLRFAVPDEYRRRPGDGLAALLTRYGLSMASEALVINDPAERYDAVSTGRADVAVAYATDGALVGLPLVVLEDDLGFFPPYRAALVSREDRASELASLLAPLAGAIDNNTMARLNRKVALEGHSARETGHAQVVEMGIVDTPSAVGTRNTIRIATWTNDPAEAFAAAAVRAVRTVFDGDGVALAPADDPVDAVLTGGARLVITTAERFFSDDVPPTRDDRLEAAAVLGNRYVHILRRKDDTRGALEGSVGVPEADASRITGTRLARAAGLTPETGTLDALSTKLRSGALDAVVIIAHGGDDEVTSLLAKGDLALAPLSGFMTAERVRALPYLRAARLPEGQYVGQPAVDTLALQVVLAGPSRTLAPPAIGGPVTAETSHARPLATEQVRALADATGVLEAPNPMLPSAWSTLAPAVSSQQADPLGEWLDTFLNIFALLFLLWLGRLITAPMDSASAES